MDQGPQGSQIAQQYHVLEVPAYEQVHQFKTRAFVVMGFRYLGLACRLRFGLEVRRLARITHAWSIFSFLREKKNPLSIRNNRRIGDGAYWS